MFQMAETTASKSLILFFARVSRVLTLRVCIQLLKIFLTFMIHIE